MEASRNRAPQRSARIVLATLMLVAAAQASAATDRERGRERPPGRSPATTAVNSPAAAPRPVKLLKLDEINEPTAAGPAAPAGSHRRAGVLALATGGLAFVAVAWVRRPRRPSVTHRPAEPH